MFLFWFILGIICWNFLEYMLHRFLGHEHKGKNFFKKEHQIHHSKANYFAPVYKKLIAAIGISIVLFIAFSFFLTTINTISFICGLIGMYGVYENTHYRYHRHDPLIKPFIILRKHHFYHHFHNPKMNHGVTTRFWDRVFQTFVKVETVKVPKTMTMDWLIENNDIKPIYANDFRLSIR